MQIELSDEEVVLIKGLLAEASISERHCASLFWTGDSVSVGARCLERAVKYEGVIKRLEGGSNGA